MAPSLAETLEYTLWLVWSCISLTPNALKNPKFDLLFPIEAPLEEAMSTALLDFAPGFLDVVQSAVPPTIEWFKQLPEKPLNVWAVYAIVLEKMGHRPKVYSGSGTDSGRGVRSRFNRYQKQTGQLPRFVKQALDDGYTITHKGFLCWAPIPVAGSMYPIVGLFLAMEATFSIVFWTMKSRTKDYCMPHLCPWSLDDIEYDGLCSHTAIWESIRGELDGLNAEQIAAREVAMEQRRIAQQAAKSEYYYTFKATDYAAWKARARKYADRRDPVEANEASKKSRIKAIAEKRFSCSPCGVSFQSQHELNKHYLKSSHISKINGVGRVYKDTRQKAFADAVRAAKTYYCPICEHASASQLNHDKHLLSQRHQKKAKAAESTPSAL